MLDAYRQFQSIRSNPDFSAKNNVVMVLGVWREVGGGDLGRDCNGEPHLPVGKQAVSDEELAGPIHIGTKAPTGEYIGEQRYRCQQVAEKRSHLIGVGLKHPNEGGMRNWN
jgi:hypothetical protein